MQKSFHIASMLVFSSAIIFSFFLVFELDFGENIDFVMLFVWGRSCWRRCKMQGLVLVRSNLKCLCNLTSSPLQLVLYLEGLNRPPQLGLGLVLPCFGR